ncbi:unnamed protein product [Blepharisma stoltei]|uniref:Uncharacterized protein n=1 Tax=Blepharisma stoltei TaxID=1481888 RepID=A0AAU9K1N9_9CILI|nr:unnamed protein product [Blepharisma stoltei]
MHNEFINLNMKNYYSRGKREEMENKLRQEQKKFETMMQQARNRQKELIKETNEIRSISKVAAAQIRLQEVQRQEEERRKRKDHRDAYISYLRGNNRGCSREREISALDLQIVEPPKEKTKIPAPNHNQPVECRINTPNTKIPRFLSNLKEDKPLWSKGDLLDSLDLSNTNLNKKPKKEEFEDLNKPEWNPTEKENWLEQNIRESIREWAPTKEMKIISEEEEKPEKIENIKPTKRVTKVLSVKRQTNQNNQINAIENQEKVTEKPKSKFVSRIKSIGNNDPDTEFLNVELECVNEAENKIEESLARLDIKALKVKCKSEVADLNQEVEKLEGSIEKLNLQMDNKKEIKKAEVPAQEQPVQKVEFKPIAKKDKNEPAKMTYNSRYEQINENEGSDSLSRFGIDDTRSIYSAHPYPRKRLIDEDERSMVSAIPGKAEPSEYGAYSVFGEETKSNRSKKYSIVHRKQSQQKLFSKDAETDIASEQSETKTVQGDVVRINPNIDVRALFFDD